MLNLANALLQLENDRDQAQKRLRQLDAALKALASLGSSRGGLRLTHTDGKMGRTISAAARKRIAAAQRAPWAKWRAARRNKGRVPRRHLGKTEA